MKIYVILPIAYEYNDEYYQTCNYGESYDEPVAAYKDRAKAVTKMRELNSIRSEQYEDNAFADGKPTSFYKILDLEVHNSDVEV